MFLVEGHANSDGNDDNEQSESNECDYAMSDLAAS